MHIALHAVICLRLIDCCVDLQVFDITKEQEKTKQAEAAAQQAQHQAAAQQYAKASASVHCKPGCFANVVLCAPLVCQQVVSRGVVSKQYRSVHCVHNP